MAFEKPITVAKVIDKIQSNRYVLPAIQREFVWDTEQIENLFDSLMKGYPIGSFLFWAVEPDRIGDFQFYEFMNRYHERDITHNEPINLLGNREIIAVLDGQQRLSALNIGLKGWYAFKLPRFWWSNDDAFPRRELYLHLIEPEDGELEKYEFKFLRDKDIKTEEDEKYWFKVGDILKFKDVDSVFEFSVDEGLVEGQIKYASRTLRKLWRVIYEIPIIQFFLEEEQDLDRVLNIFIRVNSYGTQLSYSDMLLSVATAAWQERDAREEIYKLVDDINDIGDGFKLSKDFVLKSSLFLTDIPAIEFRVNSFKRENMTIVEKNWDQVVSALKLSVDLISSWGFNWQNLPSSLAIIPLAHHLYKINSPSNFITSATYKISRTRMHDWLRIALLKRTFSGSSDNILRNVRKAMQESSDQSQFPSDAIYDALSQTTRSMRFDEEELEGVLSYRYGQSYTFSVLSMLYPWLDYEQQFNIDHIFPKYLFKSKELSKRNIPEERWDLYLEQVNNLGNLQFLQGAKNREKSSTEFDQWFEEENLTEEEKIHYRQLHMIPEMDYSFENFPQFINLRTNLLRERLAALLGVELTNNEV